MRKRERPRAVARAPDARPHVGDREGALDARRDGFSGVFWTAALIGLALAAAPFYVCRPTRSHLAPPSAFGFRSGVILVFICAFSDPFARPGELEPAALMHLLSGQIGRGLK